MDAGRPRRPPGRRTPRPARSAPLLVLLLALLSAGHAQPERLVHDVRWRGEAGVETGLDLHAAAGEVRLQVPLRIRGRLELEAALGADGELRAVLGPRLTAGPGPADLRLDPGLQEAVARLRLRDLDLSAGFERLPLSQMRLVEPASLETPLATGERRGPLGVRAALYTGPWRARVALLAPTGDDLVPDGVGAAASLRFDRPAVTVEGHAAWTTRPLLGATVSTTLGTVVGYGEAWLLADPWQVRAGVGATGYAGEWLWTAEAAWASPAGALLAEAGPRVALNASRAFGPDASLDATVTASWPAPTGASADGPAVLAAAAAWRHDVGDGATLTLTPSLRRTGGALSGSLGVSIVGYF